MARKSAFALLILTLSLTGVSSNALEQLEFQMTGEDAALTKRVRAASGLLAAEGDGRTAALDLFADARAEYARLIGALYAAGYYGPVIHVLIDGQEAADIAPLDAPAAIGKIVVTVDPGPQFRFTKAALAPLPGRVVLPTGFAVGQVAKSGVIQEAVQTGIKGWREQGFAKAQVGAQDLVADHGAAGLSAAITLDTGPRLRFGPLTVQGADRIRLKRVIEIAGVPVGERFSATEAARVAERLRRTGVFSSVTLTEDAQITPPDLLGMTAELVEARRHRYTFGAEIASADGAVLSGSWLHRNLAGGGERFEVTGEVSGIGAQSGGADYVLGFTLDRPATPGPDTTATLAASVQQVNDVDATSTIGAMSVGFTHYFTETLTGTVAVSYDSSIGHDAAGDYAFRSVDLPLGLTWDRRNSKTDPTGLFYLNLDAKPFYGFGATDSGARLAFDARAYKGFGDNRVVLAARLQGGAVLIAELLDTPREDLFYSGGGGTVRGQPYQSLGVTVNDGGTDVRLGGNQFLAGSLEARLRVTDKIGLVGFVDMGLVGVRGGASDVQAGAGIGVRYATGVGPVRLDLAMPVQGGSGVQVYVGLGQAF